MKDRIFLLMYDSLVHENNNYRQARTLPKGVEIKNIRFIQGVWIFEAKPNGKWEKFLSIGRPQIANNFAMKE